MSEQEIKTVSFVAPAEFTKKYRELSIQMGISDNAQKLAIRHNDAVALSEAVTAWENADSEIDDLIFQTMLPMLALEDADISSFNNCFILLSGNVIQIGILSKEWQG